ncbi:MAG TPA: hypothetical protein VHB02_00695 [Acidimicrobiales bacterium]|nr:hypothetical protein [Acidimicrobiales bacterium]
MAVGIARSTRQTVPSSLPMLGAIGVALAAVAGVLVTRQGGLQVAIVMATLPLVLAVVWSSPHATVLTLAVWMILLGLLRRLLPGGSTAGVGDPVLLVGPAILVLLFVIATGRGALRGRTLLANAVALLSMLAVLEALNPAGGLLVGLGGLLFILVPMLAFWVGRTLVDDGLLRRLLWIVAVLSVAAAAYGLFQQFAGFPSWDERWIHSSGYTALQLTNGVIRAFGPFSSAQEYGTFLSFGLVAWVALARRPRKTPMVLHLSAVALLVLTLVLESERGTLVLSVLALAMMLAARTGRRPWAMLVVGVLALVALNLVAAAVLGTSPTRPGKHASSTSVAITHDLAGLAHPTSGGSTLSGHVDRVVQGMESAFTHPLGYGTGSVTLASGKLGNAKSRGTENDLGNAAIAMGLAGLVLFVVVMFKGYAASYRLAAAVRDAGSLAVLGLLVVLFGQWTNGDLYSMAWLAWLGLGWVDARGGLEGRPMERDAAHPGAQPLPPPGRIWRPERSGRPLATLYPE